MAGKYLKAIHVSKEGKAPDKKKEKLTWQQNLTLYVHDLMYLLAIVMVIFCWCSASLWSPAAPCARPCWTGTICCF